MSDQVIGATLQVDATSAAAASKTTAELKQNVKDLKVAFDHTKVGSAEQAEAFKKLQAAQGDLSKSTTALGKATEEGGGHFANIREQVSSMPGPLGEAGEGANKLNLQLLKVAANPVGLIILAIVGALALLYKSFTNSFEGGEKMEQIFAGIKAAGQALIDNIGNIASAIVKLMKFDFSGAIADIKGVAKAAGDAFSAMANLTKEAQELHKDQLANDLDQAKRAKDLAILREQATDETIPVAKRKAALLDLQKAAQDNAVEDIALAKKVTENKIAQLSLQKDGELKNRDEINKLKIEQINVETDNANELRRIGKQITSANKAEKAEQKAEAAKAAEEAKKRRQELVDFTNKLLKIQQETELAAITDTYEKEKKLLENKLADEKRANDLSFEEKKITRAQHDRINLALDAQAAAQRATLAEKHNNELATKEAAFQKDLQGILAKIKEGGESDARAVERIKLQAEHEQKVADAIKTYKDDAIKFQAIKNALDAQLKADQDKLDAKFKLEDEKKKLAVKEQENKVISEDKKRTYTERLAAVDDEQALLKKAFDDKIITELDYNTKVDALSKARAAIHDEEQKNNEQVASAIGQTFGNLAKLAGEQTALGKTFAIAQATMDTYSSAVKAYNAMAGIPVVGPALGIVAAGAAIAAGIANVKKIVDVQVPGQGSSGSAPTALSTPAAPVAPTQVTTIFHPKDNPTTGTAASNRVYVLDADIQNAQDRNARLERAARLGG